MRRSFLMVAVACLSLSFAFAGEAFAQEKPKDPPRKSRVDFYTGTIVSLDARTGEVVVKRRKESRVFRVVEEKDRKQIEKYAPGDKVMIKHVDGVIQSIIQPGKNKPAPPAANKKPPASGAAAPSPPPAGKK